VLHRPGIGHAAEGKGMRYLKDISRSEAADGVGTAPSKTFGYLWSLGRTQLLTYLHIEGGTPTCITIEIRAWNTKS